MTWASVPWFSIGGYAVLLGLEYWFGKTTKTDASSTTDWVLIQAAKLLAKLRS